MGTDGTSTRNGYEGPGSRVLDLALVRTFQFVKSQRIEARVDPRVMQFALK